MHAGVSLRSPDDHDPRRTHTENAAASGQRTLQNTTSGMHALPHHTADGFVQSRMAHSNVYESQRRRHSGPKPDLPVQLSMRYGRASGASAGRQLPTIQYRGGINVRTHQQPLQPSHGVRVQTGDSEYTVPYQSDYSWTLTSPHRGNTGDDEHDEVLRSASQWQEELSGSASTGSQCTDATPDGSVAPFLAKLGTGATEYADTSLGTATQPSMSMHQSSFRPPSGLFVGAGGCIPSLSPPPASPREVRAQEALRFRTNSDSTPSRSSMGGGVGSANDGGSAVEPPRADADSAGGGGLAAMFAYFQAQAAEQQAMPAAAPRGKAVLPARPSPPLRQAGIARLGGGASPNSSRGGGGLDDEASSLKLRPVSFEQHFPGANAGSPSTGASNLSPMGRGTQASAAAATAVSSQHFQQSSTQTGFTVLYAEDSGSPASTELGGGVINMSPVTGSSPRGMASPLRLPLLNGSSRQGTG